MNAQRIEPIKVFILIGLVTTSLLLGLKIGLEKLGYSQRWEAYGYEFLQARLPQFSRREEIPVIVVDISKLGGGTSNQPTPRGRLQEIIDAVARQYPKAIAVDVDFSPSDTEVGWVDPENDPQFLEHCLELSRKQPIFLGVDRGIESPPEAWLGVTEYQSMAVGMRFPLAAERMLLWVRAPGVSEKLPSLSLALAQSYRRSVPRPPAGLAFMLEEIDRESVEEQQGGSEITYAKALVNYSKLDAIASQSLAAASATSIADNGERFHNKLVILGRLIDATDRFAVPGRGGEPVPGVLLHAAATYTLVKEPLFEFTHTGRFFIDLLLALFLLGFVAFFRFRHREDPSYNWHRKELVATVLAVAFTVWGGILLIQAVGVLWFDFLAVAGALLLHAPVGRFLTRRWRNWRVRAVDASPVSEERA